MDPRTMGGVCLGLVAACGAELVPRETPQRVHGLESAVLDDGTPDDAPRYRVRTPHVDCRSIDEVGYRRGKRFPITVVSVDGDLVERRTADAYWAMRKAAAAEGIDLVIYSAFRTQAEQAYFYRCFRECSCNGCTPAAKPGHSNHQSGRALDLGMRPGVHSWLVANAKRFGFRSTVKGEPWHWEYRPSKRAPSWPALCPDEPRDRRRR
jgi:D-alanyl-D-alanine carboxypeptidase